MLNIGKKGTFIDMKSIWNLIELVISSMYEKCFHKSLSLQKRLSIMQFLRFSVVGVSNSLISYGTYALLVKLKMHYILANITGFSLSVFNAHYWNNKYVFVDDSNHRNWWKTFAKTYLSYALSGIVISNILITVWIEIFHCSKLLAPLINIAVTLPFNFFINKLWAYKSKGNSDK